MKIIAIYLLLLAGLTNTALAQVVSEDEASISKQEALSPAISIGQGIATQNNTAYGQGGTVLDGTIETLQALASLRRALQGDIGQLHLQQEAAKSKGETQDIAVRLEKLREDLKATT
ncbi:MAG: TolA-binding protein, partial [Halioglobus sp.]